MACLLSFGAVASSWADVTLELRAVKRQYLVGEPVVAIVTVRGSGQVWGMGYQALSDEGSHFRFLVDRGEGFRRFVRERLSPTAGERVKIAVDGEMRNEYVLSYDAAIADWFLAAPGTTRLVAEYEDSVIGRIRSEPVTIEVLAPDGEEKIVHDAIRNLPGLGPRLLLELDARSTPYFSEELEAALVSPYSRSVYLQGLRERDLAYRLSDVSTRVNPEDPASQEPAEPREAEELLLQRRRQFVREAEELAEDLRAGQFEPDALLTLANLYAATGNDERAREIYARIVQDFPDRQAAVLAREEIEDSEAPALTVTASPARLWPPNHRLVPVTVTLTVRDDEDANPIVALDSIICDDGCDAAQDVAGAEYGTDDRAFALRAERSGKGSGRTYTITYSAKDAAGNVTRETATVVVPHDQGKR